MMVPAPGRTRDLCEIEPCTRWILVLAAGVLALLGFRSTAALLAILVGWSCQRRLSVPWRRVALTAIGLVSLVSFLFLCREAMRGVAAPPEADVKQFWLHARVAVSGLNFYEPAHAHALAAGLGPSDAMLRELFFWYPPPTMFLFLPMGWMDLVTAAGFWYSVLLLSLAADVYLLWRVLLAGEGKAAWLLSAALLLLLGPTRATIAFGQLNLLTLAMLLLCWRRANGASGGAWLALAMVTKLYTGALGLFWLVKRRMPPIAGALGAAVALSVLSVAAFGWQTCLSYISRNPSVAHIENATIPGATSIAGAVSRAYGVDTPNSVVLASPVYAGLSGAIMLATVGLVVRARGRSEPFAMAALLPFGMLVYPITGAHYAVVLLVPMCLLWTHRRDIPGGAGMASTLIASQYWLLGWGPENAAVAGIAVSWLSMGMASLSVSRQRPLAA